MTSIVPRSRTENVSIHCPGFTLVSNGKPVGVGPMDVDYGVSTSTLLVSSGNPVNPKTGLRESGGPFCVTHHEVFVDPVEAGDIVDQYAETRYSGPVWGTYILNPSGVQSHQSYPPTSFDPSSLDADGATAIAQCAPTNPTANLASTLAESVREGIPSLPGIQSWKKRTEILRAAGSEYLNYQFGWDPLRREVTNVVDAARHHRDIMQNYRHNEGSNVHRRFDFDSEDTAYEEELSPSSPNEGPANGSRWQYSDSGHPAATRINRVVNTRKRWFEGCFTYGGPSKTDSFGRAIGFGSEADAVFGLALSPDVLWDLTPWSWAVDWFSNTGDVIHNVTNFALAGLVMRYGYMMEETISESYTEYGPHWRYHINDKQQLALKQIGPCRSGERYITKRRAPANPFGFGIGWEDLSPTQLAITAAIGITRLL